jgi:chromate transporter
VLQAGVRSAHYGTGEAGQGGVMTLHTRRLGEVAALFLKLGANEVLVLLAAGAAGVPLSKVVASRGPWHAAALVVWGPLAGLFSSPSGWLDDRVLRLGLFFLKVGALLFGSGMVLFAFIQQDVVERYGWLTQQQLIDAIAVGQMTPGPVLSSATFIGYLVAGLPGAVVSTLGVFLPSFLIVAVVGPWTPRLRRAPAAQAFLNGVNAAVVALILGVAVALFASAVVDVWTAAILLVGLVAMLRSRLDTLWLVLGGAACGLARYLLVGP